MSKSKATLTVNEAQEFKMCLQKKVNASGGFEKPAIVKLKGDRGEWLYYTKKAVKDAFEPHFDRISSFLEDIQENQKKIQEINETKAADLTEEQKDRISEIRAKNKEIREELDEIGKKKETFTLPKGKQRYEDVKAFIDSDETEILEFALDFSEPKKKESKTPKRTK